MCATAAVVTAVAVVGAVVAVAVAAVVGPTIERIAETYALPVSCPYPQLHHQRLLQPLLHYQRGCNTLIRFPSRVIFSLVSCPRELRSIESVITNIYMVF